jgi:acetyl-CoA synthetase
LEPAIIRVPQQRRGVVPNLVDYERARSEFSWARARDRLDGLPRGRGLNIVHECVDRHAAGDLAGKAALRFVARDGSTTECTYADLRTATNRFANVLEDLGVAVGERVFVLTGRRLELYVAVLGTLKRRAVACTLFSAFGPEPIRQRMELGDARVLVTTEAIYRRKIEAWRDAMPGLRHVLLVGGHPSEPRPTRTADLQDLLDSADPEYEIGPTDPEDMALLHFTSGTTGTPKGAIHVHDAVVAHHATGEVALDLHADDIFWCTADPGWVTGTSYGVIAPLACGVTSVVDEAEFDADRWYRILEDERVSVWYTAPTAVRMLMKVGGELAKEHDLSQLRFVASVGEPLNPEAVTWGAEWLGLPIHDNWWQTETGGIMIGNFAAMDVKPGSMGRPLPGIDAAVLERDEHGDLVRRDGELHRLDGTGVEGELVLRAGWPSMFRGYLNEPARYAKCFESGWYRSGDLVRSDADGYYWFVGRADDVIKSAGHLIGPFEVESTLMEHDAVAEAGVIGKPDPVAGEVVKAFVVLRRGADPDEALRRELIGFARARLGAAVAPREIDFVEDLPKTRSGKIMRRLLRARELGLPEGDLSTLESGA